MNTITSSAALSAHVRGYAQAVRLHLADLGPDVADDLTDGLDADLTEAVLDGMVAPADTGATQVFDLAARFGPADEYAAELRAAAGLPASVPARAVQRGPGRVVAEAWTVVSERARAVWRPVASTPAWTAFAGFVRSLAPAWWILRGWVAAQAVIWSYGINDVVLWPSSAAGRLLVVAAIVLSVQWGRGRWVPRWAWFPRAVAVASVAAGVVAIPMVLDVEGDADPAVAGGLSYDTGWNDGYHNAQVSQVSTTSGAPMAEMDGVWVDGMQVSNIFAYDAEGNPIRDVQLFDDRGRPVRTIDDSATWDTWSVSDVAGSWNFQPAIASDGRARWNVFPLGAIDADDLGLDTGNGGFYDYQGDGEPYPQPPTGVRPQDLPWPFLKAPTSIEGGAEAGTGATDSPDEPASGEPSSDEPAAGQTGGDRPMSRTRGGTVHPGEGPTSDTGLQEPTLEATHAD